MGTPEQIMLSQLISARFKLLDKHDLSSPKLLTLVAIQRDATPAPASDNISFEFP